MSAFTMKHDFDIMMVLMLLYLQCMMDPGLLFMRDFDFAMIGEQGALEALFSCDLVNFLRIFREKVSNCFSTGLFCGYKETIV